MDFPNGTDEAITFSWKKTDPSPDEPIFNDQLLLHEEYELFFLISGDVAWFIDTASYVQKPGSLLILNSREVHKLQIRSKKTYERVRLLFHPDLVRRFDFAGVDLLSCFEERQSGEKNLIALDPRQRVELLKILEKIRDADENSQDESPLIKVLALMEALIFTSRAYRRAAAGNAPSAVPEKIVSILDHIDSNLGGDLSLERIGEACGVSIFHLSRMFKKHTGGNLHDYILYKRVSKAKKLISDGWKPKDVRVACGFGNDSAFTAAFKKIVGVTPAVFRRGRG